MIDEYGGLFGGDLYGCDFGEPGGEYNGNVGVVEILLTGGVVFGI